MIFFFKLLHLLTLSKKNSSSEVLQKFHVKAFNSNKKYSLKTIHRRNISSLTTFLSSIHECLLQSDFFPDFSFQTMMVPEMRSCRYQSSSPHTSTPPYVTSTTHQGHYGIAVGPSEFHHHQQQHYDYPSPCDMHYYGHAENPNTSSYPPKHLHPQHYPVNNPLLQTSVNNGYGCYEKGDESNQRCQSAEVSTSSENNR